MKTFNCTCGNLLFFDNNTCLACGLDVGWCPTCRQIVSLLPQQNGNFRCGNGACGSILMKCHNYAVENVCNRCLKAGETSDQQLCDYCRYTQTIPDLSVEGNRKKWYKLEVAKRRTLYLLDQLGLPYGLDEDGVALPLSFSFKGDIIADNTENWPMGETKSVFTGHANGEITINIREADPVKREKTRVTLDEAHRTLVGHFRHEIGHYYWQLLVYRQREDEFIRLFGDHAADYSQARQRHYDKGPPTGWQANYVSSYATMHPWEDFAETFATYLDMVSVLNTAESFGLSNTDPLTADLDVMVRRYQDIGLMVNEMNRTIGSIDLVPEVLTPHIIEKVRFVHDLVRQASASTAA